jgi:hypothetical protein
MKAQLGNQPRTAIPRPRVRSIAAIRSSTAQPERIIAAGAARK